MSGSPFKKVKPIEPITEEQLQNDLSVVLGKNLDPNNIQLSHLFSYVIEAYHNNPTAFQNVFNEFFTFIHTLSSAKLKLDDVDFVKQKVDDLKKEVEDNKQKEQIEWKKIESDYVKLNLSSTTLQKEFKTIEANVAKLRQEIMNQQANSQQFDPTNILREINTLQNELNSLKQNIPQMVQNAIPMHSTTAPTTPKQSTIVTTQTPIVTPLPFPPIPVNTPSSVSFNPSGTSNEEQWKKYDRMRKAGLPDSIIWNAIQRDGFKADTKDLKIFFGDQFYDTDINPPKSSTPKVIPSVAIKASKQITLGPSSIFTNLSSNISYTQEELDKFNLAGQNFQKPTKTVKIPINNSVVDTPMADFAKLRSYESLFEQIISGVKITLNDHTKQFSYETTQPIPNVTDNSSVLQDILIDKKKANVSPEIKAFLGKLNDEFFVICQMYLYFVSFNEDAGKFKKYMSALNLFFENFELHKLEFAQFLVVITAIVNKIIQPNEEKIELFSLLDIDSLSNKNKVIPTKAGRDFTVLELIINKYRSEDQKNKWTVNRIDSIIRLLTVDGYFFNICIELLGTFRILQKEIADLLLTITNNKYIDNNKLTQEAYNKITAKAQEINNEIIQFQKNIDDLKNKFIKLSQDFKLPFDINNDFKTEGNNVLVILKQWRDKIEEINNFFQKNTKYDHLTMSDV